MAVAVVGALEGVIVVANAGEVVLSAGAVVPVGSVGEGEVCHLTESLAAGVVAGIHVAGQAAQVVVAGDKIPVVLILEVAEGVDQIRIKGAEAAGGDASAEAIASKVLDGSAEASDVEVTGSILLDGALEGEHVGAGACS